jgi:hypothetical protein
MIHPRSVLAAFVLAGAALAACSGNFGAGTTQPANVIPSGPLNPPSPTPTPNSASGIVTYGASTDLQSIPTVGGYGGAIAFPVPSPKPSGFDEIPVGVTIAVVAPAGVPNVNLQAAGRRTRRRDRAARALVYISLLATRDITLPGTPRLAVDVPRDIVTTYRETELGLGFYNSGDAKAKTFSLAVTQQETPASAAPALSGAVAPASGAASPAASPGSPAPSATPSSAPSPSPAATATSSPSPAVLPPGTRPSGPPSPTPSPTLPPQRITFAAGTTPLKLSANKPFVFVVYALPVATPAPSPTPRVPAGRRGASPAPAPSSATAGPSPVASADASAAPAPADSGAPVAAPSPSPSSTRVET